MKICCLPVGTPVFNTNCYIVYSQDGCFVIDPGFQPRVIINKLEELGVKPSHILLTHAHSDHIGGVADLIDKYRCKLAVGAGDAYRLGNIKADILLNGGEKITSGTISASVVAAPGHTEGGVCYIIENHLFSGDTLFCDDIGRTDLKGGDFETLLQSLAKLAALPGDYTVYPGHEEFTTLSHERECNRYLGK